MGFWLLVQGVGMGGGEAVAPPTITGLLEYTVPKELADYVVPGGRADYTVPIDR